MRWLFTNIAGGFVRWGTIALIGGVSGFFGFVPEAWIRAVIADPPAWLTQPFTRLCIVVVGVVLALIIFAYQRRTATIRIDFPNKVNLPYLQSIFRRSSSLLVSGVPRDERITEHEFLIGITNPTKKATARNARLRAVSVSKPMHAVDLVFKPVHSNSDRVDVQPGDTELFLVVHGYDQNDVGMFSPRVLPPEQFDQISRQRQAQAYVGAHLLDWQGSRIQLLKNDDYVVELRAYADDVRSRSALMVVNARSQLSVYVYHSRLHKRFAEAASALAARLKRTPAKPFGRPTPEGAKHSVAGPQVSRPEKTATPTVATAAPRGASDRSTRELIPLELHELMQQVYEGQPPLQANRRMEQEFVGRPMFVQAQIAQMQETPEGVIVLLRYGVYGVECRFGRKWIKALEDLMPSDNIQVKGTVGPLQTRTMLALVECEIPGVSP